MKTALCAIAKNENLYIREWVEYYMKLGFSNIILYDNNNINGECFEEVINDYIESGFVKIINFRGKFVCQLTAYNDCFLRFKKDFDWIAFFDCDEFLTFNNYSNINDFLSLDKFNNFDVIVFNWKNYGDNDKIYYENKPILERFTLPLNENLKTTYIFPENNHVKSIIRTSLEEVIFKNPHVTSSPCKTCNANGKEVYSNNPFPSRFDHTIAYLKHFPTKTLEEYITIKMKRGYPDQTPIQAKRNLTIDKFFKYNTRTKEKEELIQKLLGK